MNRLPIPVTMMNRQGSLLTCYRVWGMLATIALATFSGGETISHAQVSPHRPREIPTVDSTLTSLKRPEAVRLRYTLEGHTTPVRSLLFNRESDVLISGGGTNEPFLKFWSMRNGDEINTFRAQNSGILSLAMSPNGKVLISSGEDTDVHFWQWPASESQITFFEHYYSVLALAVTPDSQLLVSGALDGIRVWTLDPPHFLYQLTGFGTRAYSLAIHPNGFLVASGDDQGKVKFWNLQQRNLISEFSAHEKTVSGLAITPDATTLITGSHDGTLKIWDIATGKLRHTLIGHLGRVEEIALSPNGQIVASSSRDGVRLWRVEDGQQLSHLTAHKNWVDSLAFSPDGRLLASGGLDRTINIWEIPSSFLDPSASTVQP